MKIMQIARCIIANHDITETNGIIRCKHPNCNWVAVLDKTTYHFRFLGISDNRERSPKSEKLSA